MEINFHINGNVLTVKVTGELDHHTAGELREKTDMQIATSKVNEVLFDFNDLSFMDSSGIGLLIGRYKMINSLGGKVAVVCNNRTIRKLIEMSGIGILIGIYDTIENAAEVKK